MKTFITGGTGLLGSNIIRELLRRKHHVRVLVRKNSNLCTIKNLDIELYEGDLSDANKLYEGCKGFDFVIHAAAKTPGQHIHYSNYMETNVKGTQNIVKAAEKARISKLVYVSSCCVFGGGTKESPGTELSEFTGFKYNSGYINSKYLALQWVLSEIEKKGLPIVIVNPTILIGPFDYHPSSGEIILRIINEQYQFCPQGGKNFIDVRDAAYATCNALKRGIAGECYLLASQNLTFAELFDKVNQIYGCKKRMIPIPGYILNTLGLAGNLYNSVSTNKIALNLTNSRQLTNTSFFSGTKAERVLGLTRNTIDNAIKDAIDWFSANNYIKQTAFYEHHLKFAS
jgi:dihydroflavonol-4-reductase